MKEPRQKRAPLHAGCDCACTPINYKMGEVSLMSDGSFDTSFTCDGFEFVVGKKCRTGNCDCWKHAGKLVEDRRR